MKSSFGYTPGVHVISGTLIQGKQKNQAACDIRLPGTEKTPVSLVSCSYFATLTMKAPQKGCVWVDVIYMEAFAAFLEFRVELNEMILMAKHQMAWADIRIVSSYES